MSADGAGLPLSFREGMYAELQRYLDEESRRFNAADTFKVDFHCHDFNSNVPDELWGRILGLPETWLKTDELLRVQRANGCELPVITNHNNARSCWTLMERGVDVLPAAEFTCTVPEHELYVHVLTYGFTPAQEPVLNKKRKNIYQFVRYCAEQKIELILPHPLYFYTRSARLSPELFEKFAVMFQRFEVINGQRDTWQSSLVLNWARSLTEEKLARYARKHNLDPADYGVTPRLPKVLTGGSDDHMGLSAGTSGSRLWVPDLARRRQKEPLSKLALEAIRAGNISPYGHVGENQRLSVALLDYFSQIATRIEDPGLVRLMLHRGSTTDKLLCLAIGNILLEMKRHGKSSQFIGYVHDALHGKAPPWYVRFGVSQDYKFCVRHLDNIAASRWKSSEEAGAAVNTAIAELFSGLSKLIVNRARKCAERVKGVPLEQLSSENLIRKFEVPLQFTALASGEAPPQDDISGLDVGELLDKLSFPVMVNLILAGSQIASTRVLYQNRKFLNDFAGHFGGRQHPRRALYLTDTLRDRNGVSNSLSGKLAEIQRRDYPVDFLICHADAAAEPHLKVVRPLAEFTIPGYEAQPIRIPDILEIARIFYAGDYDRVVCSTEGPMALAALFIKFMFNVPAYFFMHTDWLDFFKHTTNLNAHERDRIRRLMRALYHQFHGVFVLNSDHHKWLTSSQIGLKQDAVHLTAHHVEPPRRDVVPVNKVELIPGATDRTPVLFVACRLSKEKGIFELPEIYRRARAQVPGLKMVIAGVGPAADDLRRALPEATFLGWCDRERMRSLYAGLDLFVFPSKFDTFGNVLLEAFSQGMPVVAYDCKGPKDIVQHGMNGYLVDTFDEMANAVVDHFYKPASHAAMRAAALRRVQDYQAGPILTRFMQDLGLMEPDPAAALKQRAVA